jgi:iron complex outermembrane receptor protein
MMAILKFNARQSVAVAVLAWSLSVPTGAWAQAADTESPAADGEIIVTAERRDQSVLDVPVSIVAVSGDTLRDRGIDDLGELQATVPSLSFVDGGNVKFFNIRGVGLSEGAPQQTTGVAVHIDGSYVAREFVFGDSFFDVASVEVLRGPQGTFQGQNASGGAIYINTVKPKFDGFSGFIDASYGSYNRLKVGGGINIPLSSTLAIRLSGESEKKDSFNVNLSATGQETSTQPGSLKRFLGRAQLLFAPSDDVEFRLVHQYSDSKNGGPLIQSFGLASVASPRITRWDVDSYLNTRYNRTSGQMDWQVASSFKVKAMLAYQSTTQRAQRDEDYGSPIVNPTLPQQAARIFIDDKYWTGEVDLVSTGDGPLSWVVGATFLDYDNTSITTIASYNNPTGFPPAPGLTPDFNTAVYIPTITFRKNQAAFGELAYAFSDKVELRIGGRYNHDESGFLPGSLFSFAGPNPPPFLPPQDLSTPKFTYNAFTGRAVLNFKPNDDTLLYASVSRGYKPGSVSAPLFGFGGPYGSEFVTSYELGAKGSLPGGVLNYSLAAFYMDYKGFQSSVQQIPNVPPSSVTLNIDGTKIKGIEGQLDGRLGGFRWDASFSFLDSSFGSQNVIIPPGALGGGLPLAPTFENIGGRAVNFAPKFSASAGIGYRIEAGAVGITPSARVSHQGEQWVSYFRFPYTRIPAHTTFDARISVEGESGWSVDAFVTNLGNERYISNVNGTTNGIGGFQLAAPREVGSSARFDF